MPEIAGEPSTSGQPPATGQEPVAGQPTRTVEEVEAIWQGRIAGKDRAHNAEVDEYKRQIADLNSRLQQQSSAPPPNETPEQARIRELESALQKSRDAETAADRRARFPKAAEALGDSIGAVPETTLAALNATLSAPEPTPPPRMDPNAAGRGAPPQPKPLDQMSREELLQQLAGLAPAYEQELQSRR